MLLRLIALLLLPSLALAGPSQDPKPALAGIWQAPATAIVLREDGTANVDGAPATWRRFGRKKLRFKIGSEVSRPAFTLQDDRLTIQWEAGPQVYSRVAVDFPEVPPSLALGEAPPPKGKSKKWRHPRDFFTCELPYRWRVEAIDEWLMVVDPGLRGKDTLEAIVFVGWGELDGGDGGRTPVSLMKKYEAQWLRDLRKDGLKFRKAKTPPRRVLVGDVPGAEQEWSGQTKKGQAIRLWAGSIVKRDAFLYVAALAVEGKEAQYFPRAKEMFLSVIPTPPERNRPMEQRLVGKMITNTANTSSGGTGWKYQFHEGGAVDSFWYLTGIIGLDLANTSQQEWGTYEVFGDTLYLYLKSGQVEARIESDAAGQPLALHLKGARYPL